MSDHIEIKKIELNKFRNQNSPSILKPSEKNTEIPLKVFSDYWLENMAIVWGDNSHYQQLQITSVCDAKCEYCSNDSNVFATGRNKFRSIDEIEKVIWNIPEKYPGPFRLNESLPGRISEGEAFLHPKFFEVLEIIRKKFRRNEIHVTTSGSKLTPEFIEKLSKFRPFVVTYSIPSIKEESWNRIYKLKPKNFENFINSFSHMQRFGIKYQVNMTPLPKLIGYEGIEDVIAFSKSVGVNYMYIYAPGYTKYTPNEIKEIMDYDKNEMSDFLFQMVHKHKIMIEWPLDPKGFLWIDPVRLKSILEKCYHNKIYKCIFLVSKSVHERFIEMVNKFTRMIPVFAEVHVLENKNYEGNIEVSGLLVVDDLRKKVEELQLRNSFIIIPRNFLDAYGFDLNSQNILDYFKETKDYNNHIEMF